MDIYNLEKPMKALNVDGTENKRGTIKQYVDLTFTINGRPQTQRLFLTGLGKQRIILGFPWLQEQNPIINWRTGEFRWQTRVPDRDCHGLLYPAGYSRRVQQGTGTGWVSPTRAIPVPPAGGWRVGPHIQTPREIDPNDARRIVWALCRYVFFLFFVFFFQTNS